MNRKANTDGTRSVTDQFAGIAVEEINAARLRDATAQLARQDTAFHHAMAEMAKVRDFIGAPEHILGRIDTKHGEIAEQVEVGVRRARDVLAGAQPTATFSEVGRTDPMDYRLAYIDVQSKFANGSNNTLQHVLNHMGKYENFGRDGSIYHIPKNQLDQIHQLLRGDTGELSDKTVRAIQSKIRDIEQLSGRPFDEVVKPSVSDYSEVQLGKVHHTLNRHESDLQHQNDSIKNQIHAQHQPSLGEGLEAAASGAAVGAAVGFATKAWIKYRDGKNIFKGEFTADDWREVGGAAFKGGASGAVAGGAIYVLTNSAGLAAPFAAAFVSAAKGVASLAADYKAGRITREALIDNGLFICTDAAIVGLCTAAGQAVIPVPVVGAVLGSLAGKVLSSLLNNKIKGVAGRLEGKMREFRKAVGAEFQRLMGKIDTAFQKLGDLTVAAFDLNSNTQLLARSVSLARAHGVPDSKLIHDTKEMDNFMRGA